jgi:hypothetical protein
MIDMNWSLAHVEEARAFHFDVYMSIHIAGRMPDPCHSVDIQRNYLTTEPPEFIAKWGWPQGFCAAVITPYAVQEVFRVGEKRETVKLHHEGGVMEISVEDHALQPGDGDPTTSAALLAQASPREATGYSDAFDFAEAFRDAISHLPDQGGGIPDWLSTYVVVEIGAEIGGIAGFNHMYVRVRG